MTLGHVIMLDPTVEQTIALARAAGVSRFTYNWALSEWNRIRGEGGKPSIKDLKRHWNTIKRAQFPWSVESPRDANSQPFADLNQSFRNFFDSLSGKRRGPKVGYPTFRKRGVDDAFYVANDKFHFCDDGKHVALPVIGKIRICESLRLPGKIMGGRVRRVAGHWYLSVQVQGEFRVPNTPLRDIVGVDLGIKHAVVTSAGEVFDSPKPLKHALASLARANREMHRRTKGGKNRHKARMHVAKIHQRIANVRKDFAHKVTTRLARENQTVVIENLNVRGMLRNERLARALSDVGFGMIRTFLTYKCPLFGGELVAADRWFASSKRCSICGNIKNVMGLGERVYHCEVCNHVEDRDLNASKNLEAYPTLRGNAPKGKTPTDTGPLYGGVETRRVSPVVEVGTGP